MTRYRLSEEQRLGALRGYQLMDTPPETVFDEIVQEAAEEMGAPIALLSLIDEKRQWFKARVGITIEETPRSLSFCTYTIEQDDIMVVPDAMLDDRFACHPLVLGDPSIRFYAGVPLCMQEGMVIGTLCVIDRRPREGLSSRDRRMMTALAQRAVSAVHARISESAAKG